MQISHPSARAVFLAIALSLIPNGESARRGSGSVDRGAPKIGGRLGR
jgi:hypothetical protein